MQVALGRRHAGSVFFLSAAIGLLAWCFGGSIGCGLIAGVGDVQLSGHGNDATPDSPTSDSPTADTPTADSPTEARCSKPHGSEMVRITAKDVDFCIDVREAKVSELNEFLVADGDPFDAPPICASLQKPRPLRVDDPSKADLPATGMLWCYAWAYCQWAGKRLCGAIGGGEVPFEPADPKSEWTYACINGKENYTYPYGSTYDGSKCDTEASSDVSYAKVASFPNCHGVAQPFQSILDLSGNVAEYDAYLNDVTVRERGKGASGKDAAKCATADAFGFGGAPDAVGFRCCADP